MARSVVPTARLVVATEGSMVEVTMSVVAIARSVVATGGSVVAVTISLLQ